MSAHDVLEVLLKQAPQLHGWRKDRPQNWQLSGRVLRFLYDTVASGWRTLETGTGYSTIVFALRGAEHTTISPFPHEHDSIRAWCGKHGVDHAGVRFVAARSEDVVPGLAAEPLDLVLVDGAHKFPIPFIDWFYLARRLKTGGFMVVDDTHIRTGTLLRDFLRSEQGRWTLHSEIGTTAVFQKAADDWFGSGDWRGQPFCEKLQMPSRSPREFMSYWLHPVRWWRRLKRTSR